MRFSCAEETEAWKKRISQWHPFFPLWPREVDVVDGRWRCAWLETVERRATRIYDGYFILWEYRWPSGSHD